MVWDSLTDFAVEVFSYCVTSNHTHFLVRAEATELISQWMQQVEGEFAQWYNRRKKRSGAFWEGRFLNFTRQPTHARCQRKPIGRLDSFSATNAPQSEKSSPTSD